VRLGLIRYQYHHAGGAERTLGLLARGLVQRGHEVLAVVSRWEGPAPEGIAVQRVPAAPGRAFAAAALEAARRLELDTFLSLERVPGSPLYRAGDGCHAAWLERRAPHESWPRRLSFRLNPKHRALLALERELFASPELNCIIANSRLVAQEIQRLYRVPAERLQVVYNGVAPEFAAAGRDQSLRQEVRAELGLAPGEPALLFLGSGFERKGLAFALQALARLAGVRLLVAGRDRTSAYSRLAGRLGVADRVGFLGPRRDAPRLVAACDALLLPTIYDPCANACLEALAAGRPVVTTRANGAAELMEPGRDGVVLEQPHDSEELARACREALAIKEAPGRRVPRLEDWLERMMQIIEAAAGGGS